MGTEAEITFATLEGNATPDLSGKKATLNRQGYVHNTGHQGLRVLLDYSKLFDTSVVRLSMNGCPAVTIEIPNPTDPAGFDLNRLVAQEGFFTRAKGSRKPYTGELFIGQRPDGRRSEFRAIVSPEDPGRAAMGVKIDLINPTTGKVDPLTRVECEHKISDALAVRLMDRFCVGREVAKEFYSIPDEPAPGVHCYLQRFKDVANRGLVLAEFELSEAAGKFKRPLWLKNAFNVTNIPDFRTQALAVGGGMWREIYNGLSGGGLPSSEPEGISAPAFSY